ncbi:C1 family peptidase [Pseudobacteriovorax antillogorgiicola]|uniref:Papain family cysteine protease n=1 Tax=Pseudobacteriovorax antillogorgiicola TaxID=1513793 RepID=A0A1Y6BN63_9BACT|nr:C1 family peptidase [Pseudobacteriovorax antillogorgiicola]TCS55438.1 papain like protease [Pseudobacteriovorax antillogorgiicola]SMF12436.1 Papain family cysteine protease [Pseudobacteriovorax antillogorgiicola]
MRFCCALLVFLSVSARAEKKLPPLLIAILEDLTQNSGATNLDQKYYEKVLGPLPASAAPDQPKAQESGASVQEEMLSRFKEKARADRQQYKATADSMKSRYMATLQSMKRQHQETFDYWKSYHSKFDRDRVTFKKNLVDYQSLAPKKVQRESSNKPSKARYTYKMIRGARDLPIRHQGARPTCSAFATARAVEILLRQQGQEYDISEQYVYWAAKPDCQDKPCSKRGSWAVPALDHSQQQSRLDLPSEAQCPYKIEAQRGNETQVPLPSGCFQKGVARVADYDSFYSVGDLPEVLDKDQPVIAAVRLSPNFYGQRPVIDLARLNEGGGLDQHGKGHAINIVGYLELPEHLAHEGRYCYVVANSWGLGWGQGGHSCVTEKWLDRHLLNLPMIAVTKVHA